MLLLNDAQHILPSFQWLQYTLWQPLNKISKLLSSVGCFFFLSLKTQIIYLKYIFPAVDTKGNLPLTINKHYKRLDSEDNECVFSYQKHFYHVFLVMAVLK